MRLILSFRWGDLYRWARDMVILHGSHIRSTASFLYDSMNYIFWKKSKMRNYEACRTIEPSTGIVGSCTGFPEEYSARPLNISLSSFIDNWIPLHPAKKIQNDIDEFSSDDVIFHQSSTEVDKFDERLHSKRVLFEHCCWGRSDLHFTNYKFDLNLRIVR